MTQHRDTRIDVLRALALLTIFIDHIPGTVYERFTIRNWGFADAAEVFVLISGASVGLAYAPKFAAGQRLLSTVKMWKRAGVLYCAHIMTTVATLTIFCGAAVLTGNTLFLEQNNIPALIQNAPEAFVGVGLLGHQLGYNNILSLYAVLLLFAPLMLWCLGRSLRWTLAGSAALWLAAGIWQIAPPNYPTQGFWFLNPLSWQLLFVIGIAGMMHVRAGGSLPSSPRLAWLAAIYLAAAFLWIRSPLWGHVTWLGLPPVIGGFDKTFMSLSRLLDVLAMGYLVATVPAVSRLLRVAPGNGLAILGRHSLPVFVTGTIFAMLAQALKLQGGPSRMQDFLLVATGIGLQFAVAYFLEWLAMMRRRQRAAPHGFASARIA